MKKNLIFFCFLLSLTPFRGFSSWTEDQRSLILSSEPPFRESYIYSLWGSCKEKPKRWSRLKRHYSGIKIKSSLLEKGYFGALLSKKREGDKLIIFLPGAFTNVKDKQSRAYMDFFHQKSLPLLVFPSPWSIDYIRSKPLYELGSVSDDIASFWQGLKNFLKVYQKKYGPKDIEIMGVSYGGFLAMALSALDYEEAKSEGRPPLITGHVSAFSPPHQILRALELIDSSLLADRGLYREANLKDFASTYIKSCKLKPGELPSSDLSNRSRVLTLSAAFLWELAASSAKYDDLWKKNEIPSARIISRRYRKWRDQLTFTSYLVHHSPRALAQIYTQEADFMYWVQKARENGHEKIRVLTSQDDFINDPNVWPLDPDFVELEHGGHYGYRSDPWYQTLLNSLF